MKRILLLILLTLLYSCKSSSFSNTSKKASQGFEVIAVPILSENDTVISNELRFYQITSALNGMQLMYDEFGKWDMKLDGRYQHNVPQLVWHNISLPNSSKIYTIAASGAETKNTYFASIAVLDSNNMDSLKPEDPNSQLLISYFTTKMKELGDSQNFYATYRSK